MRLGFGLYRHMLSESYFQFARQCGARDIVVHLCDYGHKGSASENKVDQPIGDHDGWGVADHPKLWTLDEILDIKAQLKKHGLRLYGIENFDPAQWHDILLAGPKRNEQLEQAKKQIEIFAKAGAEIFGYNFSLAGVTARNRIETRGGAIAVGMQSNDPTIDKPLPKGMVWNMTYDSNATGYHPAISHEELWDRLEVFLRAVIPVAEQWGIKLAAHPDDPPLPRVRQQPRLVYQHNLYQKLIDLVPSSANQLEFCVGTLAEMPDGDLYELIGKHASQGDIGYVHLRNVRGHVPDYSETFIDDGDVDISRVIRILAEHNFDGVIIPDHAPQMSCDAPWHAGMAYAMGYIQAKLQEVKGTSHE